MVRRANLDLNIFPELMTFFLLAVSKKPNQNKTHPATQTMFSLAEHYSLQYLGTPGENIFKTLITFLQYLIEARIFWKYFINYHINATT